MLDGWGANCVCPLVLWMSLYPDHDAGSGYGTRNGVDAARRLAFPERLARALPYPAASLGIVGEIATWPALGALWGAKHG